jgi:hypothetical protein
VFKKSMIWTLMEKFSFSLSVEAAKLWAAAVDSRHGQEVDF